MRILEERRRRPAFTSKYSSHLSETIRNTLPLDSGVYEDPAWYGLQSPFFAMPFPNTRDRVQWAFSFCSASQYKTGWLGEFRMAKGKKKAESIFLVCKETGDYNYTLRRKPGGEKLTLKKYCPRLRKHTEHTEKKK
jgi:large subunit ribosomal protein L33